jgi:pectate lyase
MLLLALLLSSTALAQLPAFRGAEGFGAVATGGRGGRIVRVTTLASSGSGSLAEALAICEPRFVVFRVSGVIEGDVDIPCGDVTIAGQTAPGAGITIHGRLLGEYDTSVGNMIIRHLRVRPPPLTAPDEELGPQYDAIQLSRQRRLILDHVTASFGSDETLDVYEAQDVTLQWVTIEESSEEGQPEGPHNYGMINGPDGARISVHHILCAHHRNRCPAIANGPADVINNVIYDVRHGFVHHNPAMGEIHLVGNTYRDGPSDEIFPFFFDDEEPGGTSYFLASNFIDDPGVFTGEVGAIGDSTAHPTFEDSLVGDLEIDSPTDWRTVASGYVPITTQAPMDAYEDVLSFAGAFPRDAVTRRTIEEVRDRKGSWGAHPRSDLLEGLTPGTPYPDEDSDGIDDGWETEHGLDPADGTDHATAMPSGYTAIEEFLDDLSDSITGMEPTVPPIDGSVPGLDAGPRRDAGGTRADGGMAAVEDDGCGCRTTSAGGALVAFGAALCLVLARGRRKR